MTWPPRRGGEPTRLVQQAVAATCVQQWFKQQVQLGIGQIARGKFIEEDEMHARVERMLHS